MLSSASISFWACVDKFVCQRQEKNCTDIEEKCVKFHLDFVDFRTYDTQVGKIGTEIFAQ